MGGDFDTSRYYSSENYFFILHHLYLAVLSLKEKKTKVKNLDKLINKLVKGEKFIDKYPLFQIVKWIGVIYAMQNEWKNALETFNKIRVKKSTEYNQSDFTTCVLKLVIKLLMHLSRYKLKTGTHIDLENELASLDKLSPGIKNNLESLGINKYKNKVNSEWDAYELSRLLPFYYS